MQIFSPRPQRSQERGALDMRPSTTAYSPLRITSAAHEVSTVAALSYLSHLIRDNAGGCNADYAARVIASELYCLSCASGALLTWNEHEICGYTIVQVARAADCSIEASKIHALASMRSCTTRPFAPRSYTEPLMVVLDTGGSTVSSAYHVACFC